MVQEMARTAFGPFRPPGPQARSATGNERASTHPFTDHRLFARLAPRPAGRVQTTRNVGQQRRPTDRAYYSRSRFEEIEALGQPITIWAICGPVWEVQLAAM